ncbi:Acyl-CoA synthetase (AMP-forming)/AMP-acid ligase II [Raineyella antarctica]|uniref:Acyl-CoA synthetase (AMP-forming)/AMP-acid ligase II n=2 Tax=Raineyella antarctica TaxID=1577474 RepID=A0A1G6I5W6_9ACTN|nr:Acyl-CoA synthetase (AMP-forming)/AMP-acid ligase II [Raineyella antarctica]
METTSAERPALFTVSGDALSHEQVGERVDDLVRRLPDVADGRCLVHLPLRPDLESVLGYLATLEAGHVALVTPAGDASAAILDRYRPDVAATGDPDDPFQALTSVPQHVLHPDLALLLSTSGSTGSPKLVRLSHQNLRSNATAIATALRITEADRAITSLPLHYTFGLSVLHSHLVAGASVVLHDGSVMEDAFWRALDDLAVTNLAVVPHMVELMESTGVLERPHPSLRLVAQAGGRMHPDHVLRTHALGRRNGWDLAVMYGQTEATARICVLDPATVAANPDAVGRPVARTSVRLDATVPEATDGAGEVVVRGPGVMMGYAEHPDDLALGAMLTELRTGDLGRLGPDGLLRLVGRRSGFVKVMGVRIDVAAVEDALESAGFTTCVGGDADRLTVLVEPQPGRPATRTAADARRLAGRSSGLGRAAVAVAVAELPRLLNGKVDRPGAAALVQASHQQAAAETGAGAGSPLGVHPSPSAAVARVIGDVLGTEAVDLDRTFVQHGGDSLSHVQASIRLEGLVGPLPRGWHHRPLADLVDLADSRQPDSRSAVSRGADSAHLDADRTGSGHWRTVETDVVLRAIAVITICGSHAQLFHVLGGAHILLAVAGFNAARFGLSVPTIGGRWRATARVLLGVAIPTMAVAFFGMVTTGRYGWANIALSQWLIGDPTLGPTRNEFWFIDALVACLLVLTAVLSIPAIGRAWQRDPWRVAVVVGVVALVPRFVIVAWSGGHLQAIMPTTFWLFALGAAAASAASAGTRRRRLLTLALASAGGLTFFPDDPARNLLILAGLAALALLDRVRIPAPVLPLVSLLASASLYIYLVQFLVLSQFENDVVETVAAIATGCLVWRLAAHPMRRLQDLVPPPTR